MLPAVVQDEADGTVLMVGWMNPLALETTLATGNVTFWSRTRDELWTKGETSGNFLRLKAMSKDCEGGDTLIVVAEPAGPTCSEGTRTCFDGTEKQIIGDVESYRSRWGFGSLIAQIDELLDERAAQIANTQATSYTLGLLRDPNKAAKKFGEEVLEFVQAVFEQETEAVEQEFADLIYGGLVLARARAKEVSVQRIFEILTARNQAKRAGSDERFNVSEKGASRENI